MKYLLATLAVLLSTSSLAMAQVCQVFDPIIIENLFKDYGESPVFTGVGPAGEMVYITLNPATGTFTLLVVNDKVMCETGNGTGGETKEPRKPGTKES